MGDREEREGGHHMKEALHTAIATEIAKRRGRRRPSHDV